MPCCHPIPTASLVIVPFLTADVTVWHYCRVMLAQKIKNKMAKYGANDVVGESSLEFEFEFEFEKTR